MTLVPLTGSFVTSHFDLDLDSDSDSKSRRLAC